MIGRVRWRLPEVDSTQNIAFRLAELGSPHGTVVRADYQSAGRGRQGRVWESPRGSALMFSVILRPSGSLYDLAGISILVADVLADSLAEIVTAPVQIKWPNDVLITADGVERKVSGVLSELVGDGEGVVVIPADIADEIAGEAIEMIPIGDAPVEGSPPG